MNGRNKMSKKSFIVDNVFWAAISVIWYKNILYRCIPGWTLVASDITLYGLLISLSTIGVLLTIKKRRNDMSILVNLIIPYEVYSVIAFWKDATVLAIVSIATSFLIAGGYYVMAMSRTVPSLTQRKRIMRCRMKSCMIRSRTIIAFCMMIFMIPLGINTIFGGTMAYKSVSAEVPSSSEEYTIANNIDIVCNLLEDKWESLKINEKADTLQTCANIEAYYLGLPHELNIKIGKLKDSTIAQYDDTSHIIAINILYLDSMSASDILDSVLHESYHAYQHRLCDAYHSVSSDYRGLLAFSNVPEYEQEFQNYTDGNNNFFDYYYQTCESNAREYAEDGVYEYYHKIGLYKNPNNWEETE